MKRICLLLVLSLTAWAIPVSGQDLAALIAENPSRAAGDLHVYEVIDGSDSPAPEGYTPFYISHYGRHGSRYHSTDSFFTSTIRKLTKCREAGILTREGYQLLSVLEGLQQEHDSMVGILTQVGSEQHQEISERMYGCYPEVFSQPDRPTILAVSSPSPRCIQSMANFCTTLKGHVPQIDIRYFTGERFMSYICQPFDISYMHERKHAICDSILHADFNTERLMRQTFTDPVRARKLIGGDKFFKTVFDALSILQDLDVEGKDFYYKFFTLEELTACNRSDNARYFATWCISKEFGDKYVRGVGGPLLKDFIEKADAALSGNGHAADLRFGHDSGITPLLALIGADGFEVRPEAEAGDSWPAWKYTCMASNIQMVFYHNASGDVLVKMRRNESEFLVSGLRPVTGYYYSWPALRKHFLQLIDGI